MRDSFIFYRSFYEALQNVPKKNRAEVYEAVFAYAFESREPSLSGVTRALWELIRPQLDASQKRYDNAKKGAEYGKMGAEYGKMGGRPKKEKTPLKGDMEVKTKNPLNVNVNDNENVNENENVNVNVAHAREETHTHNTSPLMTEVASEIYKQGYQMSGEEIMRFVEYNRAKGWKIPLPEALKMWNDKKPSKPTGKKNFLNNAMQRAGDIKQQNDELKAKLIAMQMGG